MTLLAFITMSLAWSFSWFASKLQIDSFVPLELSVFYRLAITSVFMFVLCFIFKQRTTLHKKEIPFFFVIGLTNFCLNFCLGYYAVNFIPSGVVAVIFSLSIVTSEVISSLVDKRKISQKVVISSFIGFIGLCFFILPSLKFSEHADTLKTLTGVGIVLLMVLFYSIGNAMVVKNKKINHTPLYTSISYGCAFGSLILLTINLVRGNKFVLDFSPEYLFSLAYLIIIASVIAFICLFYLIHKIGAAKANYTALVYPTLALITSSLLENFQFSFFNLIGFLLIIYALVIEFVSFDKLKRPMSGNRA